ncbi:unnamed protein product [Linum trigynum]
MFAEHNFLPSQTVEDVKARIEAAYGIAIERQTLWLGRNKLTNNNTLDSYKINRPAVPTAVHLEIAAAANDGFPITVNLVSRFFRLPSMAITCKETNKVAELKKLILAKWPPGYARTKINLFCHGRMLADDEATLLHYLVSHGAVIRVKYWIEEPVDPFPYCVTRKLLFDPPFLKDDECSHILTLIRK